MTHTSKPGALLIVFIVTVVIVGPNLLTGKSGQGSDLTATSPVTKECIECHTEVTPQIVFDWEKSLHARTTPFMALKKKQLARRISIKTIGDTPGKYVVGCFECHSLNSKHHKDTFSHNDQNIHVVVTPQDCALCHPVENMQYQKNKMAHAYGNLVYNSLYRQLVESINGIHETRDGEVRQARATRHANLDSCLSCHGSIVEVKGFKEIETEMGEMTFPVLTEWPNQGVGRINPDGSKGACTSCHPRHQFSIEVARKPYSCSQCHSGPDVPVYKVYSLSKHGNIYSSLNHGWNFTAVPWKTGEDFTTPTCAVCHISLITGASGEVVVQRSHQMNDRLPWRLFGLFYSHPQPKEPDTTIIKNKAGLPLPTELTGEPVSQFLIDKDEQEKRLGTQKRVCKTCHASQWTDKHFARLKLTIAETDRSTLAATQLLLNAWKKGIAKGPGSNDNIFNERVEKYWVRHWLFYANSVRFASAMMGVDYGAFQNGRWELSENIVKMMELLNEGKGEGNKKGRKFK